MPKEALFSLVLAADLGRCGAHAPVSDPAGVSAGLPARMRSTKRHGPATVQSAVSCVWLGPEFRRRRPHEPDYFGCALPPLDLADVTPLW